MSDANMDEAERKHLEEKVAPRVAPLLGRVRMRDAALADEIQQLVHVVHGAAFVAGAIYGHGVAGYEALQAFERIDAAITKARG